MPSDQTEPLAADPLAWTAPLPRATSIFTWIALSISLFALAGSFWFGFGLKVQPYEPQFELCIYHRAFDFAVAGILATGLLTRSGRSSPLSMLALPPALTGLGAALLLVFRLQGQDDFAYFIFYRLGLTPLLGLLMQAILVATLVFDLFHCGPGRVLPRTGLLKALILAALLLGGAVLLCVLEPKPNRTFGEIRLILYGPK